MPSPTSQPARVPGYDLAAPAESDALASLQRVFGHARGVKVWAEACARAGVAPAYVNTIPLLERVADSLGRDGGAAATIARSISIRVRTYTQLVARAAAAKTGARA
jgi:hypothetical protein